MSEGNVELARRAYEAFNRGDLDDMVADFAPTFEYASTGAIPGAGGAYRGADGMREFLGWLWNEFESPRAEIGDLIEAGDQVLAELTLRGRGKQSGAEASWDVWQLWTVRDGKIVRGQAFTSRERALEAAGLSDLETYDWFRA